MIKVSPKTRKVTFQLNVEQAEKIAVVGDFNNWDSSATPMKFNKRAGVWKADVTVPAGVYQFRYLVNDSEWVNDDEAPVVPNPFGTVNSIAEVADAPAAKKTAKKATKKVTKKA
jgi:1,4-alpha-glucan branching enzyme